MNAKHLYSTMESDFRLSTCDDDWSEMKANEYITAQYQHRYMGLVTDHTDRIDYVYTAVFPSTEVVAKILRDNKKNALLFLHHPMDWDINRALVFSDISRDTLKALEERNISIYNLHTPLDAIGPYSTSCCFADTLGIGIVNGFYEYHKVNIGVIGKTEFKTVYELKAHFETTVGHTVKLYQNNNTMISNGKVALVAGGGNDADIYPQLRDMGINTYLTGIANMQNDYPPSVKAHRSAKECGVNILAGTHYSTEKFACMKMVDYFADLGIPSEFIPGKICLEDM